MSFAYEEMRVINWARERGIYESSNAQAQFLKGTSEWGELADALAKGNMDDTRDAVGDVLVCMINMCQFLDIDMTECLRQSVEVISKRKGKMVGGVFVKESA